MKIYLYTVIFLFLSCGNNEITVTEDQVTSEIFYEKGSYNPFTGKCIVVYNNSKIIKEQFTLRNGVLDGESIAWYRNGNLRRKGNYNKGQISGKWLFWDMYGHKTVEANYRLGSLNGPFISLYANGKIKEKGSFTDNRQTGKWLYYDENGELLNSCQK